MLQYNVYSLKICDLHESFDDIKDNFELAVDSRKLIGIIELGESSVPDLSLALMEADICYADIAINMDGQHLLVFNISDKKSDMPFLELRAV
jgi:hypothetical protein